MNIGKPIVLLVLCALSLSQTARADYEAIETQKPETRTAIRLSLVALGLKARKGQAPLRDYDFLMELAYSVEKAKEYLGEAERTYAFVRRYKEEHSFWLNDDFVHGHEMVAKEKLKQADERIIDAERQIGKLERSAARAAWERIEPAR